MSCEVSRDFKRRKQWGWWRNVQFAFAFNSFFRKTGKTCSSNRDKLKGFPMFSQAQFSQVVKNQKTKKTGQVEGSFGQRMPRNARFRRSRLPRISNPKPASRKEDDRLPWQEQHAPFEPQTSDRPLASQEGKCGRKRLSPLSAVSASCLLLP